MLDYPVLLTVATQQAYDALAPGPQEWRPWESPTPGPWWQLEGVDASEALLLAHADVGDAKPLYLVDNLMEDGFGGPTGNDIVGAGLGWEWAYVDLTLE